MAGPRVHPVVHAPQQSTRPRMHWFMILGGVVGAVVALWVMLGSRGPTLHPFFWGTAMVLVYLAVSALVSGRFNPFFVIVGADGRLSSSQFQFFLWTGVVLFVYVSLVAARAARDMGLQAIDGIPPNVLLAMGLSITTALTAKGITVAYVASGRIHKTPPPTGQSLSPAGLVAKDDLATPDLAKIQMMTWTVLAVVLYVADFVTRIGVWTTRGELPDIPQVLMVLMGLGQGAYLGGKLVMADVPHLTGISPTRVVPGGTVTIVGTSFGSAQAGSLLAINGGRHTVPPLRWGDDAVSFRIPVLRADGTRWSPEERVDVGLWIGGRQAGGDNVVVVAMPNIAVAHRSDDNRIVVTGGPFGTAEDAARLVVGGRAIRSTAPGVSWSNERIEAPLPSLPRGDHEVRVEVNGYQGSAAVVSLP